MSAFKGTPGPWSHREWEPDGPLSDSVESLAPNSGDGDIICLSPEYVRCEESALRWEANARLIAAAPELLGLHEADLTDLDLLTMAIHAGDPMPELVIRVTDMLNRKLAAIARATGADQ